MTTEAFQLVRVGDIEVAWVESGEGEPLVLLHGGEGDQGQFGVFRPWLGPGIRAISYDQRDTGDTVNGPEPYDMARLASDCAGLIAALGLDRAHVLGASYGGMIALHVAIRHPERVRSLILAGTTPSRSMVEDLGDRVITMGPAERAQFMLDMLLSPEAQAREPGLVTDAASALRRRRSPEADARRIAAVQSHDCAARLSEITAPTLILHGADDPVIGTHVAELMAARIPDARLEILPRARHGVMMEARERSAQLIREFVLSHRGLSAQGR